MFGHKRAKSLKREQSLKDHPTFNVQVDVSIPRRSLGLRLRPVPEEDLPPYDLHAEVSELTRLASGRRGPIDEHNLNAPIPSQRVYPGMRLSMINSSPQTGRSYQAVVECLSTSSRPLVLRFVDCAKGISDLPLVLPSPVVPPVVVPPQPPPRLDPLPSTSWISWASMFAISFPTGRFGIIWTSVDSRLSTQVAALPKHPAGLKTLAERYNNFSDDLMHIRPGVSLAAINNHSLDSVAHDTVLNYLRQLPRPIILHFCVESEGISDAPTSVPIFTISGCAPPVFTPPPVPPPVATTPVAAAAPPPIVVATPPLVAAAPAAPVATTAAIAPVATTAAIAPVAATAASAPVATAASAPVGATGGIPGAPGATVAAASSARTPDPAVPVAVPGTGGTTNGAVAETKPKGKAKRVVENPKLKKDRVYSWNLSTEITFGAGTFGMKTQDYAGSAFSEFHVEVYEITPKGSLDLLNAKTDRKVKLHMRLVAIDGQGLQNKPYDEVLGLLRAAARPVTITFADASQSTVEDREYEAYLESIKPVSSSWWGGASTVKPLNYLIPVEISFGEGPLGLETRDVEAEHRVPLHVEVNAIVQILEGGHFGPVSLYNWNHPRRLHLKRGMRIYQVNEKNVWSHSYNDVLDTIRKAPRPVRVTFIDPEGILCDAYEGQDEDEEEMTYEELQTRIQEKVYLLDRAESEFANQDTNDLNWSLAELALLEDELRCRAKISKMQSILKTEEQSVADLTTRIADLNEEEQKIKAMIEELDQQINGTMENPLIARTKRLEDRSTKLHERTKKLKADNKKLKTRQEALQTHKDELEAKLAALPEEQISQTRQDAAEMLDVDLTTPLKEQLAAFKRHFAEVSKEFQTEDRRRKLVKREVDYMRKHVKSLAKAEKKLKKQSKGKKSKNDNDSKISNIREKLKLINDQLATAAEKGDKEQAMKLSKRRKHLTKELKLLKEEETPPTKKKSKKGKKGQPVNDAVTQIHRGSSKSTATPAAAKLPFFVDGMLDKHPTISNETDIFSNTWKNFKKPYPRYCVVTPRGTLAYYRQKGDHEARGELHLDDKTLEIVMKGCEFTLCSSAESTKFEARSSAECRKWVEALRAANGHFIRGRRT
ncbi:hypothetical protein Ae201684P_017770 [Aphanomyces euteiches]|uniref:PH domain-containing protein n=1 Tax=Aphanomyces euteiches TaxID=100861 RepID=A0A6G0XN40_9STRA|nr:hypothetical protein Ae201684_003007 [Aphanomyces euteiches]KAH9098558.1 hypothetical protein Ae201684P_017770 [Aphanomyces euteiches]